MVNFSQSYRQLKVGTFLRHSVDMAINIGKSACMRIASRQNVKCMNIRTVNSHEILWCDKIKYFAIYLISIDNAKRMFYRAFNAVLGKLGVLPQKRL